jgi:DNA mismatch endonuclease (patch repair protein)
VADTLSKEQRSALMKRVRRSDTAPELKLRKALHREGLRYVIGNKRLPGSPDLVFPKHRTVVFVHGCFWHGHECRQGRAPTTRQDFWVPKIEGNQRRDARKQAELEELGWRVITIWECELKRLDKEQLQSFAASLKARVVSPKSKAA